jgi:hypothetical protein
LSLLSLSLSIQEESERGEYVSFCLRIVDKIAELFPATVPSRIGPHLSKLSDTFFNGTVALMDARMGVGSAPSTSSASSSSSALSSGVVPQCVFSREMVFVARDLSVVIQIYSRMAPYLAQNPQSMFSYLEVPTCLSLALSLNSA